MSNKPLIQPMHTDLCLAFYQPDIPQNVGASMRLSACMGVEMDVIEPTAFLWKDSAFRRTGMDYVDHLRLARHASWNAFLEARTNRRIILLTTKTDQPYTGFTFKKGDILLCGQESAGVPEHVHSHCPHHVTIPMMGECRSLNVVNAAAMVLGEALRQIRTP